MKRKSAASAGHCLFLGPAVALLTCCVRLATCWRVKCQSRRARGQQWPSVAKVWQPLPLQVVVVVMVLRKWVQLRMMRLLDSR